MSNICERCCIHSAGAHGAFLLILQSRGHLLTMNLLETKNFVGKWASWNSKGCPAVFCFLHYQAPELSSLLDKKYLGSDYAMLHVYREQFSQGPRGYSVFVWKQNLIFYIYICASHVATLNWTFKTKALLKNSSCAAPWLLWSPADSWSAGLAHLQARTALSLHFFQHSPANFWDYTASLQIALAVTSLLIDWLLFGPAGWITPAGWKALCI